MKLTRLTNHKPPSTSSARSSQDGSNGTIRKPCGSEINDAGDEDRLKQQARADRERTEVIDCANASHQYRRGDDRQKR